MTSEPRAGGGREGFQSAPRARVLSSRLEKRSRRRRPGVPTNLSLQRTAVRTASSTRQPPRKTRARANRSRRQASAADCRPPRRPRHRRALNLDEPLRARHSTAFESATRRPLRARETQSRARRAASVFESSRRRLRREKLGGDGREVCPRPRGRLRGASAVGWRATTAPRGAGAGGAEGHVEYQPSVPWLPTNSLQRS